MRHAALIGALCAVCATACSEEGTNISGVQSLDIVRVTISPKLDTLFVADTLRPTDRLQMQAEVIGRLGNPIVGAKVAWTSSKPQVALVTESGVVVPTGYGTTVVSASASKVASATIVVMPAARTVVVTPGADTIFVEDPIAPRDSILLKATAYDENGDAIAGVAFSWSSALAAMATVNTRGSVLARGLGVVTVSARTGEQVGSANVRVASIVKSIQTTSPVTAVLAKDTVQLTATALGYDDKPMAGRTFTWTSSNPQVATVDANGRAIFLRSGFATFTAKSAFTTSNITVTALERQFLSIDAGTDATCGFTNLGRGYCWGSGEFGRMASGTDSSCFGVGDNKSGCALSPKRFNGPPIEFTAVSLDSTNGCGISKDKLVYCWGDDSFEQIGNGGKGAGELPRLATVMQIRFDSIAVGGAHACAISTTRRVYCWGRDAEGQLGETPGIHSTTPIPINSTLQFSAITAGRIHTCGISAGAVYCWGDNTNGQLGGASTDPFSDEPLPVTTSGTVAAISAGAYHTCALTTTGSALCWGADFDGQSGAASVGGITSGPEAVGGPPFARISAGASHTCAITAAGATFCWGGDPKTGGAGAASPTQLAAGLVFRSITAGDRHTCGIASDGETYCWGSNVFGTLGNELQAAYRTSPEKVAIPR